MADPIIDNAVRAQCIFQGPSGLAEDRYVTSWAFIRSTIGSAGQEEQSDEVAERLREFWLEETTNAQATVFQSMAGDLAPGGLQIRTYDLGQSPPREPRVYDFSLPGAGNSSLPREVAVTMSFFADRNLPRQRGRVFIGPVSVNAMTVGGGGPRPTENLRNTLAASAERLSSLGMGVGDQMQWAVLSPTDAEIRPVTAGWIDDAFDTQRRRGESPTTRTAWPSS